MNYEGSCYLLLSLSYESLFLLSLSLSLLKSTQELNSIHQSIMYFKIDIAFINNL